MRPPPESCQIRAAVTTSIPTGDDTDPGDGDPLPPCAPDLPPEAPCEPPPPPPPPPPSTASWTGSAGTADGVKFAEVVVAVAADGGAPVEGARVILRFEITEPASSEVFYSECTTPVEGSCTVRFDSPYSDVTKVVASVVAIDTSPAVDTDLGGLEFTWS
jgi:hypothetical protein